MRGGMRVMAPMRDARRRSRAATYFKTPTRGVGVGSESSTHWIYTNKKFYSTRDPVYIRSKVRPQQRLT